MKIKLQQLKDKKTHYQKYKDMIDKLILEKYELDFAIRYTHESTKIEGNTLSLIENKLIIEDRMSVGGIFSLSILMILSMSTYSLLRDNGVSGDRHTAGAVKNKGFYRRGILVL